MIILAIETSCDETAISVLETKGGLKKPQFRILSNIVASQVKIHAKWGGVVPNLAKREHQKNLIPVLKKCLKESGLIFNSKFLISNKIQNPKFKILNSILEREPELLKEFLKVIPKIKIPKIDVIAVTVGPGLEPALWVGINFARALSLTWGKPIIGINHMEGHIVASLLNSKIKNQNVKLLKFPALALLVSGGHTELVLIKKLLKYKIIGQTRDDAAGEAFDKVAKMLKLGYPGGPIVSKLASGLKTKSNPIKLPRPMINSKDYDFSFSGLKTAVLYLIRDIKVEKSKSKKISKSTTIEICAEFQQAVTDVLIKKTIRAVKEYKIKTVILGGGVSANKELRKQLQLAVSKVIKNKLQVPEIKFTGDNGAMIAVAASLHATKKPFDKLPRLRSGQVRTSKLKANGNLPIGKHI